MTPDDSMGKPTRPQPIIQGVPDPSAPPVLAGQSPDEIKLDHDGILWARPRPLTAREFGARGEATP